MGSTALLSAFDGLPGEVAQAVALLRASGVEEPDSLTVGEGDRLLVALCRELTRGDVTVLAMCPCGELVEAVLSPETVPPASARMTVLGTGGGLREPTYADLLELPDDPDEAVRELLARCVVGSPSRAPRPDDLELVDDSLAGPIVTAWPACGEALAVDLDVERAVLERLARRAREIDHEIHLLASAYHWSLAEIEALDDGRRGTLAGLVADGS
jgi:hypothetical protein